jgi:xanthine dehydrogenase accessory factor
VARLAEAREVYRAVEEARRAGKVPVVAEIVAVRGSAYRRPGALMMMTADGRMVGTLSGGCLEGDLFVRAEPLFEGTGGPFLADYDLSEDEMWSLGIGCKGQVTVWVRPAATPLPDEGLLTTGGVTVAHLPGGPVHVYRPDHWPTDAALRARAEEAWAGAEPRWADGVYVRAWRMPEVLVIVGAGHDAVPLAALAQRVGFAVVVVDPRDAFNTERRFPGCRHLVTEASRLDPTAEPDLQGAFWVVMNHHKDRDRAGIHAALRFAPRWVGALGPWSRTEELLADLDPTDRERVRGPIGLDLGAETPDEVAVSIVAELMAARRGRSGESLNRKTRLHA